MPGLLARLFARHPRPKRWIHRTEDLPWYDRPDALETLDRRVAEGRDDPARAGRLRHWIEDGYCVIERAIDPGLLDRMNAEIDAIWTTDRSIENLQILGIPIEPGAEPGIHHWQLVGLPPERRRALRDGGGWRIHGFHHLSEPTRAIHQDAGLKAEAVAIFDRPAENETTINFMFGSRQHVHQDMGVFHISPPNYLIGAWIAAEDIHPDSGPLVYYPGSHRAPMFERFDNYPQTNLRTADKETAAAYEAYMDALCEKYPKKTFLAGKGDVLLWHGMLLHGGDGVRDPALTRRSLVIHYIPPGMNRHNEIVGPTNW